MSTHFDYFVIGGGSGGVRSARIAAGHGANVGLAEGAALGGTCVNVGCVPKKLFAYAADYGAMLHDMPGFGWKNISATLDWPTLRDNKTREIDRLNRIYAHVLQNAGVTLFPHMARFIDAHTLQVGDQTITADKILIATGGKPKRPTYPGHEHVLVSDNLFFMERLPGHVLIQGGGYIAVEFAHILHGLGVKVSLINRSSTWLRGFDHDVQDFLQTSCSAAGMDICFNCDITQVVKTDDTHLIVQTTTGRKIPCDAVFSTIGRVANTDGLDLEKAGVALSENGQIKVDQNWTTNIPHIHAVGDVSNDMNLTPYAIAEGHILADRLFGKMPPRQTDFRLVPTAVFSAPPIATVGLPEEDARAQGYNVKIFKTTFRPMALALTDNPQKTLMKLVVCADTDKVLGLHMVGQDAPEIVQGFAVALVAGATKADFDRTLGIHPTSAEEFVTMRDEVKL